MRPFEARYRIPDALPKRGAWPLTADIASRYSLPSTEVDVAAMLRDFQGGIEGRYQTLSNRLQESALWGDGMSIRSIADGGKHFEPFTGTIQMEKIPAEYEAFYNVPGRTHDRSNGLREVRGARFYANIDAAKNTAAEKNAIMVEDWQAAVETLHAAPAPQDTDAYFARIGVLDYMKQHALTAFHAFTYPERLGKRLEVSNYEELRRKAFDLARDSVRSYYFALLGRDDVPVEDFDRRLDDFREISQSLIDAKATHKYYKAAEIDHPMTLLMNADATADAHPDTDTIVALPSGGTQMGFAIEMAMELKNGKRPHVIALPLSNHSHIQTFADRTTCEELENMLVREGAPGKRVIVADDNSNSGNSVQTTVDLLQKVGAAGVTVSLAELDPIRIIYKHSQEEPPETVTNMLHSDFTGVAGIVPIARSELPLQVRKMYAQNLLRRHYEQAQPVLGVEITPHPYERSVSARRPYLVTSSENKAKAGHRFGLRVFNGDSSAVDKAEREYDEAHGTTEGVIAAEQAGDYMRGVAMAKLEGVCNFIAEQGENLASKDAYAYAREAAVPPSVIVTDTNLLLGGTLLKKPATPVAAENIYHAYEDARATQGEIRYVTHVGRLDLTQEQGQMRSVYQVAVTLGTVRPDADLTQVQQLLQTKPDRVGGIGSYKELMGILTPQPMVLEVTKWDESKEVQGQFTMSGTTRVVVPLEQVTPDLLSMVTRGFVPNR